MIPAVIGNFLFYAVEMIDFQRLVGLISFSLHFGCWEMGDGKTAKVCSRFGHERKARWPVGPKARAARLS
jgi:hypothetical protein